MNSSCIESSPNKSKSLFAALKVPDYLFLWTGMVTAAFAMNMQTVAQGWLVYEMSSSALDLAWVSLAQTLPTIIFSLTGGVIADRFPKKPIIGFSPLINGTASLVMGCIIMLGEVSFWDFIWVAFINGTAMALSIPARTALIPEVVGERLVFNAMAYNMTAWNLARILGPALAGFMIAKFAQGDTSSSVGVGLVFFILSFLYFTAAITVIFIKHHGRPSPRKKESAYDDLRAGIKYLFRTPVVAGLMLLTSVSFLFGTTLNTLLPAFNSDVLSGGPDDLGLLLTGMGVGAIIGSLTMAQMGNLRHKGFWLISISGFWGLALIWLAFTQNFLQAVFVIAVVGFLSTFTLSMNRSLLQLQAEPHMRGRVMSFDMMAHGLMPIGLVPIGYLSEVVSIEAGLATSGGLFIVSILIVALLMPELRKINTGYSRNYDS